MPNLYSQGNLLYALRDRFDKELDALEADGIILPVEAHDDDMTVGYAYCTAECPGPRHVPGPRHGLVSAYLTVTGVLSLYNGHIWLLRLSYYYSTGQLTQTS
ncbi:hypothetical protein J6590_036904 [Homalodisca vitripennis]|nr:hypothetical protein J6590_036904 [Homalodisca vitripennis]